MEHDTVMTVQTIRSCLHLVFALGPVIAAAVVASRLGGGKGPASAVWLLAGLYLVALVIDSAQFFLPAALMRFADIGTYMTIQSAVSCGLDLPIVLLTGVAFLMMKPAVVSPPAVPA